MSNRVSKSALVQRFMGKSVGDTRTGQLKTHVKKLARGLEKRVPRSSIAAEKFNKLEEERKLLENKGSEGVRKYIIDKLKKTSKEERKSIYSKEFGWSGRQAKDFEERIVSGGGSAKSAEEIEREKKQTGRAQQRAAEAAYRTGGPSRVSLEMERKRSNPMRHLHEQTERKYGSRLGLEKSYEKASGFASIGQITDDNKAQDDIMSGESGGAAALPPAGPGGRPSRPGVASGNFNANPLTRGPGNPVAGAPGNSLGLGPGPQSGGGPPLRL